MFKFLFGTNFILILLAFQDTIWVKKLKVVMSILPSVHTIMPKKSSSLSLFNIR